MDVYRVTGVFRMGGRPQKFTKEFAGANEKAVREQVLSTFGSLHRVERRFITIESMEKIPADDATDQVVAYKAGKK